MVVEEERRTRRVVVAQRRAPPAGFGEQRRRPVDRHNSDRVQFGDQLDETHHVGMDE